MPIYQKTIATTSNEKGFILTLYDKLTEINGLTLYPENPDDLFSNVNVAYEIVISYKNFSVKLTRDGVLDSMCSGLQIDLIDGSELSFTSNWMWGTSSNYTDRVDRTLKFTLVDGSSGIELFFADYSASYLSTTNNIILIPYMNTYMYSNNNNAHSVLSSLTFYKLSEVEPYSLARNFNFMLPESGIKTIEYTSLLNSNGDWIGDIQGLINCSIVPNHSILTINNKRYFSLGQDTIVEI